ncbi:BMP family ABC transporter substrate-binding protein [Petrotoga sp. 9PWA.NaAc.5.4]|uniref:BMP family ABC transporter substrate-binding protein n=1 Tax=Petrotoga sp. 9PWA.NaAc.5.4 TaxID=1434328 RepID=UPI000CC22D3E|nr:BMP family ABC transporter substrate-binding protein [Petrotoga sp. 9PWA.NaAc.5.4]PNR95326.1 ABC transporter substrate-binding protein [Petrotoga sp. 9PWA.NaAc.5.4]
MYRTNRSQSRTEYEKAYRLARRDFLNEISKGKDGYLPALEDIIQNVEISKEQNLGTIDIPIERIKGTYYHSRAVSFSKNFYPLMKIDTEFASKWINLYEAQAEEGIREPVTAYEYLNWFYIVEGNKRVSILKYLNAFSTRGEVIRLIPKWDEGDPEIKIYYEFLDFYEKTKINIIWFDKEGKFKELYELIKDYEKKSEFVENKYDELINSIYLPFRKLYREIGKDKLSLSEEEAFIEYLKKYGIDNMPEIEREMREQIKFLVDELSEKEEHPLSIPLFRISTILSGAALKVAFIYNTRIEDSAWTYSHELGRRYVEEKLKGEVITKCFENVSSSKVYEKILEQLEEEKFDLVFSTSFDFLHDKETKKFQNVKFMHFSGYRALEDINTYYGRMYEPRFLAGMIAGAMTKTNRLGYVASYGIPEVIMGINAFALGAKSVNSKAEVHVGWTNAWKNYEYERNTAKYLIDEIEVDVLTHHQDSAEVLKVGEEHNVYTIGYHYDMREFAPSTYLTSVVWNWGIYYENIIKDVLRGSNFSLFRLFSGSEKIENFWGGLKTGIVNLAPLSDLVLPQVKNLVKLVKNDIIEDKFHPFRGPIYDKKGNLMVPEDKDISDEELMNMDWFTYNVFYS